MVASFNMMMGAFDPALLNDAYSPALAYTIFLECILVVNIVMLNLLIAPMGGSCASQCFLTDLLWLASCFLTDCIR